MAPVAAENFFTSLIRRSSNASMHGIPIGRASHVIQNHKISSEALRKSGVRRSKLHSALIATNRHAGAKITQVCLLRKSDPTLPNVAMSASDPERSCAHVQRCRGV